MSGYSNLRSATLSVAAMPLGSSDIRTTRLVEYANGIFQGQTVESNGQVTRIGLGVFAFDNGDFYFGEWENNQLHGEGLLIFAFGGFLHGFFEASQLHGPAFLKFSNGEVYEGFWQHGLLHGEAYNYFIDEAVWLRCRYNQGKFQTLLQEGQGRAESKVLSCLSEVRALSNKHRTSENPRVKVIDYKDGRQFLGCVNKNQPCGLGLLRRLDDKGDVGFFNSGQIVDLGRIHLAKNGIYDGFFNNGKMQGPGVYYDTQSRNWFFGKFSQGQCQEMLQTGVGKYPLDVTLKLRSTHHIRSTRYIDEIIAENIFYMPTGYNGKILRDAVWQPQKMEALRSRVFADDKNPKILHSVFMREQVIFSNEQQFHKLRQSVRQLTPKRNQDTVSDNFRKSGQLQNSMGSTDNLQLNMSASLSIRNSVSPNAQLYRHFRNSSVNSSQENLDPHVSLKSRTSTSNMAAESFSSPSKKLSSGQVAQRENRFKPVSRQFNTNSSTMTIQKDESTAIHPDSSVHRMRLSASNSSANPSSINSKVNQLKDKRRRLLSVESNSEGIYQREFNFSHVDPSEKHKRTAKITSQGIPQTFTQPPSPFAFGGAHQTAYNPFSQQTQIESRSSSQQKEQVSNQSRSLTSKTYIVQQAINNGGNKEYQEDSEQNYDQDNQNSQSFSNNSINDDVKKRLHLHKDNGVSSLNPQFSFESMRADEEFDNGINPQISRQVETPATTGIVSVSDALAQAQQLRQSIQIERTNSPIKEIVARFQNSLLNSNSRIISPTRSAQNEDIRLHLSTHIQGSLHDTSSVTRYSNQQVVNTNSSQMPIINKDIFKIKPLHQTAVERKDDEAAESSQQQANDRNEVNNSLGVIQFTSPKTLEYFLAENNLINLQTSIIGKQDSFILQNKRDSRLLAREKSCDEDSLLNDEQSEFIQEQESTTTIVMSFPLQKEQKQLQQGSLNKQTNKAVLESFVEQFIEVNQNQSSPSENQQSAFKSKDAAEIVSPQFTTSFSPSYQRQDTQVHEISFEQQRQQVTVRVEGNNQASSPMIAGSTVRQLVSNNYPLSEEKVGIPLDQRNNLPRNHLDYSSKQQRDLNQMSTGIIPLITVIDNKQLNYSASFNDHLYGHSFSRDNVSQQFQQDPLDQEEYRLQSIVHSKINDVPLKPSSSQVHLSNEVKSSQPDISPERSRRDQEVSFSANSLKKQVNYESQEKAFFHASHNDTFQSTLSTHYIEVVDIQQPHIKQESNQLDSFSCQMNNTCQLDIHQQTPSSVQQEQRSSADLSDMNQIKIASQKLLFKQNDEQASQSNSQNQATTQLVQKQVYSICTNNQQESPQLSSPQSIVTYQAQELKSQSSFILQQVEPNLQQKPIKDLQIKEDIQIIDIKVDLDTKYKPNYSFTEIQTNKSNKAEVDRGFVLRNEKDEYEKTSQNQSLSSQTVSSANVQLPIYCTTEQVNLANILSEIHQLDKVPSNKSEEKIKRRLLSTFDHSSTQQNYDYLSHPDVLQVESEEIKQNPQTYSSIKVSAFERSTVPVQDNQTNKNRQKVNEVGEIPIEFRHVTSHEKEEVQQTDDPQITFRGQEFNSLTNIQVKFQKVSQLNSTSSQQPPELGRVSDIPNQQAKQNNVSSERTSSVYIPLKQQHLTQTPQEVVLEEEIKLSVVKSNDNQASLEISDSLQISQIKRDNQLRESIRASLIGLQSIFQSSGIPIVQTNTENIANPLINQNQSNQEQNTEIDQISNSPYNAFAQLNNLSQQLIQYDSRGMQEVSSSKVEVFSDNNSNIQTLKQSAQQHKHSENNQQVIEIDGQQQEQFRAVNPKNKFEISEIEEQLLQASNVQKSENNQFKKDFYFKLKSLAQEKEFTPVSKSAEQTEKYINNLNNSIVEETGLTLVSKQTEKYIYTPKSSQIKQVQLLRDGSPEDNKSREVNKDNFQISDALIQAISEADLNDPETQSVNKNPQVRFSLEIQKKRQEQEQEIEIKIQQSEMNPDTTDSTLQLQLTKQYHISNADYEMGSQTFNERSGQKQSSQRDFINENVQKQSQKIFKFSNSLNLIQTYPAVSITPVMQQSVDIYIAGESEIDDRMYSQSFYGHSPMLDEEMPIKAKKVKSSICQAERSNSHELRKEHLTQQEEQQQVTIDDTKLLDSNKQVISQLKYDNFDLKISQNNCKHDFINSREILSLRENQQQRVLQQQFLGDNQFNSFQLSTLPSQTSQINISLPNGNYQQESRKESNNKLLIQDQYSSPSIQLQEQLASKLIYPPINRQNVSETTNSVLNAPSELQYFENKVIKEDQDQRTKVTQEFISSANVSTNMFTNALPNQGVIGQQAQEYQPTQQDIIGFLSKTQKQQSPIKQAPRIFTNSENQYLKQDHDIGYSSIKHHSTNGDQKAILDYQIPVTTLIIQQDFQTDIRKKDQQQISGGFSHKNNDDVYPVNEQRIGVFASSVVSVAQNKQASLSPSNMERRGIPQITNFKEQREKLKSLSPDARTLKGNSIIINTKQNSTLDTAKSVQQESSNFQNQIDKFPANMIQPHSSEVISSTNLASDFSLPSIQLKHEQIIEINRVAQEQNSQPEQLKSQIKLELYSQRIPKLNIINEKNPQCLTDLMEAISHPPIKLNHEQIVEINRVKQEQYTHQYLPEQLQSQNNIESYSCLIPKLNTEFQQKHQGLIDLMETNSQTQIQLKHKLIEEKNKIGEEKQSQSLSKQGQFQNNIESNQYLIPEPSTGFEQKHEGQTDLMKAILQHPIKLKHEQIEEINRVEQEQQTHQYLPQQPKSQNNIGFYSYHSPQSKIGNQQNENDFSNLMEANSQPLTQLKRNQIEEKNRIEKQQTQSLPKQPVSQNNIVFDTNSLSKPNINRVEQGGQDFISLMDKEKVSLMKEIQQNQENISLTINKNGTNLSNQREGLKKSQLSSNQYSLNPVMYSSLLLREPGYQEDQSQNIQIKISNEFILDPNLDDSLKRRSASKIQQLIETKQSIGVFDISLTSSEPLTKAQEKNSLAQSNLSEILQPILCISFEEEKSKTQLKLKETIIESNFDPSLLVGSQSSHKEVLNADVGTKYSVNNQSNQDMLLLELKGEKNVIVTPTEALNFTEHFTLQSLIPNQMNSSRQIETPLNNSPIKQLQSQLPFQLLVKPVNCQTSPKKEDPICSDSPQSKFKILEESMKKPLSSPQPILPNLNPLPQVVRQSQQFYSNHQVSSFEKCTTVNQKLIIVDSNSLITGAAQIPETLNGNPEPKELSKRVQMSLLSNQQPIISSASSIEGIFPTIYEQKFLPRIESEKTLLKKQKTSEITSISRQPESFAQMQLLSGQLHRSNNILQIKQAPANSISTSKNDSSSSQEVIPIASQYSNESLSQKKIDKSKKSSPSTSLTSIINNVNSEVIGTSLSQIQNKRISNSLVPKVHSPQKFSILQKRANSTEMVSSAPFQAAANSSEILQEIKPYEIQQLFTSKQLPALIIPQDLPNIVLNALPFIAPQTSENNLSFQHLQNNLRHSQSFSKNEISLIHSTEVHRANQKGTLTNNKINSQLSHENIMPSSFTNPHPTIPSTSQTVIKTTNLLAPLVDKSAISPLVKFSSLSILPQKVALIQQQQTISPLESLQAAQTILFDVPNKESNKLDRQYLDDSSKELTKMISISPQETSQMLTHIQEYKDSDSISKNVSNFIPSQEIFIEDDRKSIVNPSISPYNNIENLISQNSSNSTQSIPVFDKKKRSHPNQTRSIYHQQNDQLQLQQLQQKHKKQAQQLQQQYQNVNLHQQPQQEQLQQQQQRKKQHQQQQELYQHHQQLQQEQHEELNQTQQEQKQQQEELSPKLQHKIKGDFEVLPLSQSIKKIQQQFLLQHSQQSPSNKMIQVNENSSPIRLISSHHVAHLPPSQFIGTSLIPNVNLQKNKVSRAASASASSLSPSPFKEVQLSVSSPPQRSASASQVLPSHHLLMQTISHDDTFQNIIQQLNDRSPPQSQQFRLSSFNPSRLNSTHTAVGQQQPSVVQNPICNSTPQRQSRLDGFPVPPLPQQYVSCFTPEQSQPPELRLPQSFPHLIQPFSLAIQLTPQIQQQQQQQHQKYIQSLSPIQPISERQNNYSSSASKVITACFPSATPRGTLQERIDNMREIEGKIKQLSNSIMSAVNDSQPLFETDSIVTQQRHNPNATAITRTQNHSFVQEHSSVISSPNGTATKQIAQVQSSSCSVSPGVIVHRTTRQPQSVVQPQQLYLIPNGQTINMQAHPNSIRSNSMAKMRQSHSISTISSPGGIRKTPQVNSMSPMGERIQVVLSTPVRDQNSNFNQQNIFTSSPANNTFRDSRQTVRFYDNSIGVQQPLQQWPQQGVRELPKIVQMGQISQMNSMQLVNQSQQAQMSQISHSPMQVYSVLTDTRRQTIISPAREQRLLSSTLHSPDPARHPLNQVLGSSQQVTKTPVEFITYSPSPKKVNRNARGSTQFSPSPSPPSRPIREIQRIASSQTPEEKNCLALCGNSCNPGEEQGEVQVTPQNLFTLQQIQQQQYEQLLQQQQPYGSQSQEQCNIF